MHLLLDNHTQIIMQVAVSGMLCLVMLLVWKTQKTYPGFGQWTVSKLPVASAFLLLCLRGVIPDWASIFIANLLLCISPILLYEGIRKFRGKPHRDAIHYGLFVIVIVTLCFSFWIKPSIVVRLVCLFGFTAVLLLRCAVNLFVKVPPAMRPSYWFTAAMFSLYDLVLLFSLLAASTMSHLLSPFSAVPWLNLVFLATIVLPIGWTFGFFMMTNARLTHELQTTETDLRAWATIDSLTGALTRRSFIDQGKQTCALARRTDTTVSILLLDMDFFKAVNDNYGHRTGDKLLCAATVTCRSLLRASDLLARWGGEEFAVLLFSTDIAGGLQVAEKLRVAVAAITIPSEKGDVRTTLSAGCAEWSPTIDLDTAIHHADTALYQAKALGRNCVIAYNHDLR